MRELKNIKKLNNQRYTHQEPMAFRGNAKGSVSAGNGVPYANPLLDTVMTLSAFAPEGLELVTSPGIAVGVDEKGYLVPAGGDILPMGIISKCLRSTAPLFEESLTSEELEALQGHPEKLPPFGSANLEGGLTGMDDLHGLVPQVFQNGALFERGYAWKKDGASKALFELKVGNLLRPIKPEEIETCITDDTLPVLFGESKTACPRTKGYYAGMLVKFVNGTDDPTMVCARVGGFRSPAQYDNIVYTDGFAFDYDVQGISTHGQSRNVWNTISAVYGNEEYEAIIVDFYANM